MKTHFVGFQTFNYNTQSYNETFINLASIASITNCANIDKHSLVTTTSEEFFAVKGTPRDILCSLYDRVPRDSMTITYSKEEDV